jgi:hypothetical protein
VIGPSHFAGAVGMRSRASRRRLSDNDIRCSASDRRWFPARPAQQVDRRRNNGKGRIPSTLASAHGRNGKRRVETCNALQRRTRRSASTIGSAAPDTIIGRAAADRAGARPYRATRSENASKMCHADRRRPILEATTSPLYARRLHQGFFAEMQSIRPRRGSNPRRLCLTNVYFGQQCGNKRLGSAVYL